MLNVSYTGGATQTLKVIAVPWKYGGRKEIFSTTVYAQEDIQGCFSEQSFEKLHGEGWLGCWSRRVRS